MRAVFLVSFFCVVSALCVQQTMLRGFVSGSQPVFKNAAISNGLAQLRLCDIGANILDDMFNGKYNDKPYHQSDLSSIFLRSSSMGVRTIICTAGMLEEATETLHICRHVDENNLKLLCTAGIHPTRSSVFENDPDSVIKNLKDILKDGLSDKKIVAIGECGLDYDRLHFCSKELQIIGFQAQLRLAAQFNLPLFLHNRNTEGDFARIIQENLDAIKAGGVVHSFTGSVAEMLELTALGLYIGINGCSLKTEEGLEVASLIPEHLLLLETDAPWCGVKPTHAGHKYITTTVPTVKKEKHTPGLLVKDRNEPCLLVQILEIVAHVRKVDPLHLADVVYENSKRLFKFE